MTKILKNPEVRETVETRVLSLLNRRNGRWQGTMTELLDAITSGRQTPEAFPASPSSLRRVVDRVVPALRRRGFRVQFLRSSDHERTRLVSFSRKEV